MPHSLLRSAPPVRRRLRRGLTLFELLIVLTILGISAGVVVLRPGAGVRGGGEPALARARRLAVARAEVLRLEVRDDGAWSVLTRTGTTLDEGRDGGTPLAIELDALGSCHPVPGAAGAGGTFDPLGCRWRRGGA